MHPSRAYDVTLAIRGVLGVGNRESILPLHLEREKLLPVPPQLHPGVHGCHSIRLPNEGDEPVSARPECEDMPRTNKQHVPHHRGRVGFSLAGCDLPWGGTKLFWHNYNKSPLYTLRRVRQYENLILRTVTEFYQSQRGT